MLLVAVIYILGIALWSFIAGVCFKIAKIEMHPVVGPIALLLWPVSVPFIALGLFALWMEYLGGQFISKFI